MATPRALTAPSACRHCGIPERSHYQQWKPPVGWHSWVPPTQVQILARMKARRAARAHTPKGKLMNTPPALATIAALHTLLTDHPELAALPIRWGVEQDGDLHASPRYLADGSHAAVRALAEAVGGKPYEYTTASETGKAFAVVAISGGTLAGTTVHSYGYELAPAELVAAAEGSDA